MSYRPHRWRLYASDENFYVANMISQLCVDADDIDHWFHAGQSVFSGTGDPPTHPHIHARPCGFCESVGCYVCCWSGVAYHWIDTPEDLVQEAIRELHHIIEDLDKT